LGETSETDTFSEDLKAFQNIGASYDESIVIVDEAEGRGADFGEAADL